MLMNKLVDKEFNENLLNLPQLNQFYKYLNDTISINLSFFNKIKRLLLDNKEYEFKFELVIENQRGFKMFGIPFFSSNGLLPLVDPSSFQLINGQNLMLIDHSLDNLPLPDLYWEWEWDKWYVLMLDDVDDQGWIYSKILFKSRHWKGKYYFGNFIRRRVWMRLRKRKREVEKEVVD